MDFYSYEEAVRTLNTLQSNAVTIERARQHRDNNRPLVIPQTVVMAERAGVKMSDIDLLSIIHVSGTKGKGSTCAFSESILRHHGYKTGFFSSPHLVEVRERIRINGRPLSREAFSSYFWDCYKNLDRTKDEHDGEMPAYFKFLTIMAFHVFIQEQVDVAIVEVGIGGQYDCTNIIRYPVVCGVSSLGMDHVSLLGDTIEKIAWQKAGIFKPGVPAVTVPQKESALQVLCDRAQEIRNPLYIAPDFKHYKWERDHVACLGIAGEKQQINASLAMQLCDIWMNNHTLDNESRQKLYSEALLDRNVDDIYSLSEGEKFHVSKPFVKGLESCEWPGRNQVLKRPGVTYYIDGAHTDSSVQQCTSWFLPNAIEEAKKVRGKVARVLMFNVTGDRDPTSLLQYFVDLNFDIAVFCPNITSRSSDQNRADQCNFTVTIDSQLARCTKHKNAWLKLMSEECSSSQADKKTVKIAGSDHANDTHTYDGIHHASSVDVSNHPNMEKELLNRLEQIAASHDKQTGVISSFQNGNDSKSAVQNSSDSGLGSSLRGTTPDNDPMPCFVFTTIQEALEWINNRSHTVENTNRKLEQGDSSDFGTLPRILKEAEHIQVLCTGSLHLVGGVIGLLDPHVNDR